MTLKILVVDDDPALRTFLERILVRAGHDVTLTTNGAKALKALDCAEFSLVLTDIVMPDMEGLQFLRELRQRPTAPRIIAMSGGGRGSALSYLELARTFGAAATLEKPFEPGALLEAIEQVFPRPHSRVSDSRSGRAEGDRGIERTPPP